MEILCVLSIIAVVVAVAVPVFHTSRARGRQMACLAHLRQVAVAIHTYTQDYDGVYPPATQTTINDIPSPTPRMLFLWSDLILLYFPGGLPYCGDSPMPPGVRRDTGMSGYAYNRSLNTAEPAKHGYKLQGQTESQVLLDSLTVLAFEARTGIVAMSCPDDSAFEEHFPTILALSESIDQIDTQKSGGRRHNNGANYTFLDTHAKWLPPSALVYLCDDKKPCFHP